MLFGSLTFLCFFLPIALLVYYLVPQRAKNPVLLVASLVFLAWGSLLGVIVLFASIVVNYFIGEEIGRRFDSDTEAFRFLLLGIIVNLGILFVFKYLGFFAGLFGLGSGIDDVFSGIIRPVAISFYTLYAISYLVDLYRGNIKAGKNFFSLALYLSMFSKLLAGPIEKYGDIALQLKQRKLSWDLFGRGAFLFLVGLAKTMVFAVGLGEVFDGINDLVAEGGAAPGVAWLGAASFMLQIYFAFGGYCDMAVGLGNMFGFRFHRNFNYPYTARSMTDFSHRWNLSLDRWFHEYVSRPLSGKRQPVSRRVLNMLIVWALIGFWYGPSLGCLLWGLYIGILLILEKYVWGKALKKTPLPVQYVYSLLLGAVGWVFFFSDTFMGAVHYLGTMFGAVNFYGTMQTFAYYLSSNWIILVIGGICCTAIPYRLLSAAGCGGIRKGIYACVMAALFVLSFSCLLTVTGTPFSNFFV